MGVLKELYRRFQLLLHKPRHWQLRPDTIDRRIFREVVIHNEYRAAGPLRPRATWCSTWAPTSAPSPWRR